MSKLCLMSDEQMNDMQAYIEENFNVDVHIISNIIHFVNDVLKEQKHLAIDRATTLYFYLYLLQDTGIRAVEISQFLPEDQIVI